MTRSAFFLRVANALRGRIVDTQEWRLYEIPCSSPPGKPASTAFEKDALQDLRHYKPLGASDPTLEQFLQVVQKRLRNTYHVYTLCDGSTLLHYGWASGPGSEYYDEALKLYYRYPNEAVTLLDFFTHPSARGRGLYQDCLRYILADLHAHGHVQRAYIHVLNTNTPSKHVIEKVGFEYIGSIHMRRTFGKLSVWDTLPKGYSCHSTP